MTRFLLLLLLVGCGPEDEMARVAPRVTGSVIVNKAQERVNKQRTAAEQDSSYQGNSFALAGTMDPLHMTVADSVGPSTVVPWRVMRVKNNGVSGEFDAVRIYVEKTGATRQFFVAAVCNYDDSIPGRLTIREATRGSAIVTDNPYLGSLIIRLAAPVNVKPQSKLAIALWFRTEAGVTAGYGVSNPTNFGIADALVATHLAGDDRVDIDYSSIDDPNVNIDGFPGYAVLMSTSDSETVRAIKNWY